MPSTNPHNLPHTQKPGWALPALLVLLFHALLFAIPVHFSQAHSQETPPISLTLAEPLPPDEPDFLESLPDPLPPEEIPEPVEPPPPEPLPQVDSDPIQAPVESPVAVTTDDVEPLEEPPPEIPEPVEPVEDLEEPTEPTLPVEPTEPIEEPTPPQPDPTPEAPPVDWQGYGRGVMSSVEGELDYPRMALRRNLEGTAQVRIAINHDGSLARPPELVASTSHSILDREVLRMVEAAAPFPAFPDHASDDDREFVIPVRFRIR